MLSPMCCPQNDVAESFLNCVRSRLDIIAQLYIQLNSRSLMVRDVLLGKGKLKMHSLLNEQLLFTVFIVLPLQMQ